MESMMFYYGLSALDGVEALFPGALPRAVEYRAFSPEKKRIEWQSKTGINKFELKIEYLLDNSIEKNRSITG
jgi:hypothetical protein